MSRKMTGVGGVFCASHNPKGGGTLHGHTWQITAWFPLSDAETQRARLQDYLKRFDHSHLPDELTWGEDLAERIGLDLGALRVRCDRPLEHIYAEWNP